MVAQHSGIIHWHALIVTNDTVTVRLMFPTNVGQVLITFRFAAGYRAVEQDGGSTANQGHFFQTNVGRWI
jgi:hypothetical protein